MEDILIYWDAPVDVNLTTHLHLDLNCNQATSECNTHSTLPGNNLQIKVI